MIYHVTSKWDGGPLKSIDQQLWSDELAEQIVAKWPDCNPERYYTTDGAYIHCHYSLADAIEYRNEYCRGGQILEIDETSLRVRIGSEYPHPVVAAEIPADCITIMEI